MVQFQVLSRTSHKKLLRIPPPRDFETDMQHNLKKSTLSFLLQAQTLQFCIRIHTIELCFTGITAQLPGSVNVSTSAAKICKCAKVC